MKGVFHVPGRGALSRAVVGLIALVLLYACDSGLVLPVATSTPVAQTAVPSSSQTGTSTLTNPGGAIPQNVPKPAPQSTTYNGCPANGDGGDRQLNIRKNRT